MTTRLEQVAKCYGLSIPTDESLTAARLDAEDAYRRGVEDMDEFRAAVVSECNDCVRKKVRGYVEAGDYDLLVSRCPTSMCKLHQVRISARVPIGQRLERLKKGNGNG